MTEIPIQKPTLVLMAGYGGSGKTTLAHTLGSLLEWPVIDKDVLKARILRMSYGLSIEEASLLAYELLFALAQDLLVMQRLSVILDTSAVFPFVSNSAWELVQVTDVHLKILFCKATNEVRRSRLQQRNEQDAGRRQLLIDLTAVDDDNWQRFNHLSLEHLVELDTSQPFEKYLQRALLYLREKRSGLCPLSPR